MHLIVLQHAIDKGRFVCLSVHLSHSWSTPKWFKIWKYVSYHTWDVKFFFF